MFPENFRSLGHVIVSIAVFQQTADSPKASAAGAAADAAAPVNQKSLSDNQLSVSGRYTRLERMLSQMADLMGRDDPERADLLRRTISKGREQRIGDRVEKIVTLLQSEDFGAAVEEQKEVTEGLLALLQLLQSEDRRSTVEKERERLNHLLKDVRSLIAEERSARSAAQDAPAPSNAAAPQQKALDRANSLLKDVEDHDAERAGNTPSETESGEGKAGESSEKTMPDEASKDATPDGNSKTPAPDEDDEKKSNPDDDSTKEPSEESPEPVEGKTPSGAPGDKGEKNSPKNSDSQTEKSDQTESDKPESASDSSQPGKQGDSSDDQSKQTPGRQQLQDAQRLMQEALEKLKQQERDPALQKQDQALAELHEAAANLEKMLRQLREEEKEMLLASLEARLQKLLAVQIQIQSAITELAATPKEQWLDRYYDRCRELAQQQTDQTTECSMTTGLLREDGTSVSILMAMEDIETDLNSVAGFLRQSDVSALTQSVQADIIESLKQLIEATQKEMETMKQEEHSEESQQQEGQKPPLVEMIAEIKVLRSLQLRVNRRTAQVDQLLKSAQPEQKSELNQQLNELANRQLKLVDSAKEMSRKMSKP